MSSSLFNLFATAPKGLEHLLAQELKSLGAIDVKEKLGGVFFNASQQMTYKICLWSRFANRILYLLHEEKASTPQELYEATKKINWPEHFDVMNTFAVHCVCVQSNISHSLFAAQKIKDAIVDQFREEIGERPNVLKQNPDIAIYAYLFRDIAYISLDLSGESLHKRGYRIAGGIAPLKENLAAAILTRANWQEIAASGGSLLDPMCGSGTLLIEAAMIAANIAPQLFREYMGFFGWKKHDSALWQELLDDAKKARDIGLKSLPLIIGYDEDSQAIRIAFENIDRANLTGYVHVERRNVAVFSAETKLKPGLIVCNPPYGERISEMELLKPLYRVLGERLKSEFTGWQAAIFTANSALAKTMGLRAKQYFNFYNGPISCQLFLFDIEEKYFVDNSLAAENERRIRQAQRFMMQQQEPTALINRLQKNLKHYKKQLKNYSSTKIKIYDCDLPEYKFILELTESEAYITEYSSPKSVHANKILLHRAAFLAVLPDILSIPMGNIHYVQSEMRHQIDHSLPKIKRNFKSQK